MLRWWHNPLPPDAISPVKPASLTTSAALPAPVKRKTTPTLFDMDADEDVKGPAGGDIDMDLDAPIDDGAVDDVDLDDNIDDWVVDDLGDGLRDDENEKKWVGKGGVREMGMFSLVKSSVRELTDPNIVSVTKAQPAFQPGSTPMENKKRYLGLFY